MLSYVILTNNMKLIPLQKNLYNVVVISPGAVPCQGVSQGRREAPREIGSQLIIQSRSQQAGSGSRDKGIPDYFFYSIQFCKICFIPG